MSNVGPSPTSAPPEPEINSHTSTQQWQSFEFRMRHRRAERCLHRAEMALDAGLDDEAREAIDEAERLNSYSPRLAVLRSALDERAAASVAAEAEQHASGRRGILRGVAAAMVLFMTIGLGAYLLTKNASAPAPFPQKAAAASGAAIPPRAIVPDVAAPSTAVATAGDANTPPAPPVTAPSPSVTDAAQSANGATRAATDATMRTTETRSADARQTPPPKPALPEFNPQFAEARPIALPSASSTLDPAALRAEPASAIPDPPPVVAEKPAEKPVEARVVNDRPAAAVSLDPVGEAIPSSNAPEPERRPAPENPAALEEPRVRAVLSRYEAAYSSLNAAAAQAVWPAVDERSLSRAFDTLQSQRVSLGRCSVQVEGVTASASCSGSITWTPKVGGGSQTAARQWRFQLHNGNGQWQITRAEVR